MWVEQEKALPEMTPEDNAAFAHTRGTSIQDDRGVALPQQPPQQPMPRLTRSWSFGRLGANNSDGSKAGVWDRDEMAQIAGSADALGRVWNGQFRGWTGAGEDKTEEEQSGGGEAGWGAAQGWNAEGERMQQDSVQSGGREAEEEACTRMLTRS
eukprot:2006909-Rhodomonas_salina.1